MRILVVEDDPERHAFFLRELGEHDVCICQNAFKGSNAITKSKFDMIFLDHDLGGRVFVNSDDENTGYQVALKVKGSPNEGAEFIVHSMNVVGAENIVKHLEGIGCNVRYEPYYQLMKKLKRQG